MTSRKEAEQIRSQIVELSLRRIKHSLIAQQVGRKISWVRDIITQEHMKRADSIKLVDVGKTIGKLMLEQDLRVRKLWQELENARTVADRLMALRNIRDEARQEKEFLQDCGLLPKVSEFAGANVFAGNNQVAVQQSFNVLNIVDSVLDAERKRKEDNVKTVGEAVGEPADNAEVKGGD